MSALLRLLLGFAGIVGVGYVFDKKIVGGSSSSASSSDSGSLPGWWGRWGWLVIACGIFFVAYLLSRYARSKVVRVSDARDPVGYYSGALLLKRPETLDELRGAYRTMRAMMRAGYRGDNDWSHALSEKLVNVLGGKQ